MLLSLSTLRPALRQGTDAVGMPGSGPRTLSRDGKLKAGQFLPGSSSSLPDPRNGASGSLRQPRAETQVMAVEMSVHQKLACRKQKRDLRMWAEHILRASEPRSQPLVQSRWAPCHLQKAPARPHLCTCCVCSISRQSSSPCDKTTVCWALGTGVTGTALHGPYPVGG